MASPSTGRLSWKTSIDYSSFTVPPSSSSSSSSSSSFSPSSFSFSLYKRNPTSSHRTKCSLDNNSPSNSKYTTENKLLKQKKSTQVGRSTDSSSLLVGAKDEFSDSNNSTLQLEERVNRKSLNLVRTRFESIFRKFWWKKIFLPSKRIRSILLLNVIAVVYASNIPVVKEVEAITDPATFTVMRFTLLVIPFLPLMFRGRGDVQTRNAGLELGLWASLGYLMQALGLLTSDAGRASFLSLFTVIIVPLLDGMLGAKVPALTWFGAVTSLVGVGLLESSGSPPSVGDLLNFLSALFFGVHMLRTEHISRSSKRESFLLLLGYEVCVVAAFSIIWYFVGGWFGNMHTWDPGSWTWKMAWDWMVKFPWIPALYTGIFSTGACLWVEMTAMRDVSATEAAIVYGLEPVWGAGFAWFLLGERWGTLGWIGASLVLGGSLTVQIFGSSSSNSSTDSDEDGEQLDNLQLSDTQSFSVAPVVVIAREENVSETSKN